jgi:hypothetical protein
MLTSITQNMTENVRLAQTQICLISAAVRQGLMRAAVDGIDLFAVESVAAIIARFNVGAVDFAFAALTR